MEDGKDVNTMKQISYQKANQLSIYSANCLNNISPLAQCHTCTDVCPAQALSFQDGHWEVQNCKLCGLCATVCPTQVFSIDHLQLLHTQKNESLLLCCSQNNAAPAEALHLNCLQQLSPLTILHLLYQYSQITLYLTPEKCQQCTQHWYTDGLLLQLQQYQISQEQLQIIVQSVPSSEETLPGKNRRSFISDLFHRTETQSKKVLAQKVETIAANFSSNEANTEATVFPSRLPLYALYIKKQLPIQPQEILPFRLMSCIHCTFCSACTYICPTKALKLMETDQKKQLYYHPEQCINCNLCQLICMQKGLQWQDFMTQEQFLQTPHQLADSTEKICTACGESYYLWSESTSTICPRCQDDSNI